MEILILFGILFIVLGIAIPFYSKAQKRKCTCKTSAKISAIKKRDAGEYRTTYIPILEYTVNNQKITTESPVNLSQLEYTVGDIVEIYYNPNNIKELFIPKFVKNTENMWLIFLLIGILMFIPTFLEKKNVMSDMPSTLNNLKTELSLPIFMIFIWLVFFIIGMLLLSRVRKLKGNCNKKANGKIVDIKRKKEKNDNLLYPVIEFETMGKNLRIESHTGNTYTKYIIRRYCSFLL